MFSVSSIFNYILLLHIIYVHAMVATGLADTIVHIHTSLKCTKGTCKLERVHNALTVSGLTKNQLSGMLLRCIVVITTA
jgi:hypothetical protein